MKNTVSGYVVLLPPAHVGHTHGDVLKPIINCGTSINYRGLDRDPWWNLDELFYSGNLTDDMVNLRQIIQSSGTSIYSPGVCFHLSDAKAVRSFTLGMAVEEELIYVSNSPNREVSTPNFLGRDSYVDGFGSLIRLGVFSDPLVFDDFLPKLNPHGLFDHLSDLSDYVAAYVHRCVEAGLEIVEPRRIQDATSFCLYSVD